MIQNEGKITKIQIKESKYASGFRSAAFCFNFSLVEGLLIQKSSLSDGRLVLCAGGTANHRSKSKSSASVL